MSAPFVFVPRKVARPSKSQTSTTSQPRPIALPVPVVEIDSLSKGKEKEKETDSSTQSEVDHAILVLLALSDYAFWLDADQRRMVEQSLTKVAEHAGFIPLSYLLRRSQSRVPLGNLKLPPESGVVRALRSLAEDFLEVRMLVSAPSASVWNLQGNTTARQKSNEVGGYEVRRRDWQTMLEHHTRSFGREQWEKRTVYLESIPLQYRSIPGIARFTSNLITEWQGAIIRVQNIVLPPHHLDKPGDPPKCKGFALVTLSDPEDCEKLLTRWPWKRNLASSPDDVSSEYKESEKAGATREAIKFGLRCLSKARWDKLNEEYVAYGQKLVDQLVASNEDHDVVDGYDPQSQPPEVPEVREDNISAPPIHTPSPITTTTLSSPYPFDCLVFVRNIHPETNKTTLRSLFSAAFHAGSTQADGIDYVDYNKGMDSCFLRLSTPKHAGTIAEHFTERSITQYQGLDDKGTIASPSDGAIVVEVVWGRKEELYWKKVPEKVRRQAVQKAVNTQSSSDTSANTTIPSSEHVDESKNHKKRKRVK